MNKNLTTRSNRDMSPWSIFRNDLSDLFERFSQDFDLPTLGGEHFSPKVELKDTGKAYQICAEIPGMDEKDINVTLRDNQLIIEGEKKNEFKEEDKKKGFFRSEFSYGRFYRAIPLSDDIDADKVKAEYRNGVLNVEVDKLPERANRSKKIQVNAGKQAETKH